MLSLFTKQFIHQPSNFLFRTYRTLFQKEFDVSQFCMINIKCPYNIIINPIDVFKSQEKVSMNFIAKSDNLELPEIKCEKYNDTVNIDVSQNCDVDYILNVDASIKANLCVNGYGGNIHIGSFYGQFIEVNSENSTIALSKCQCERINLNTGKGNIICKDVTQAGNIGLLIRESGDIAADRIQGLVLKASTTNGTITIGSSYCDNATFEIDKGKLHLQNLHKHSTIKIKQEGLLNIVGFDGDLLLQMKKGLADIQFAQITKDSKILVEDQSSLILRLSEECQRNNLVEILTNCLVVSDNLKMDCKKKDNLSTFSPRNGEEKTWNRLEVQCEGSHVSVNSTSWSELLKSSIRSKNLSL